MRILITGAGGQLGRAVASVASAGGWDVIAWDRTQADITSPEICQQIFKEDPDIVVNAAAWTDVDGAESDPDAAYAANALGARLVAQGCEMCGAQLVHVSSNEVFAGEVGRFYYEYDQCAPNSTYARSKRAGELAAASTRASVIIVRVAWLFGPGGNNFPSKIISAARKNGALRVVADEYGNPTYTIDAAIAMLELATRSKSGTYHLVSDGSASRYEVAQAVLAAKGMGDIPVTPISASEWKRQTLPPPHAVLVNQLARAQGIVLRPWQQAIVEFAPFLEEN